MLDLCPGIPAGIILYRGYPRWLIILPGCKPVGQLARKSQGLKMSDLNLIIKSVIFFEAHSPSNIINLLNEIIFTANQLKFFVTWSTANKSFFGLMSLMERKSSSQLKNQNHIRPTKQVSFRWTGWRKKHVKMTESFWIKSTWVCDICEAKDSDGLFVPANNESWMGGGIYFEFKFWLCP